MGAPLGNRNAAGGHKKTGLFSKGIGHTWYKKRSISKPGFKNLYKSKTGKMKQRVSYGKKGS